MAIKKLENLIEQARKNSKKKVVAVFAQDDNTILATKKAIDLNFAEFILIGDEKIITQIWIGSAQLPEDM